MFMAREDQLYDYPYIRYFQVSSERDGFFYKHNAVPCRLVSLALRK